MQLYKKYAVTAVCIFVCSFIFLSLVQMEDEDLRQIINRKRRSFNHVQMKRFSQNVRSNKTRKEHIWPCSDEVEQNDRIVEQLEYKSSNTKGTSSIKTIVLAGNHRSYETRSLLQECPEQKCIFSKSVAKLSKASAVVFIGGSIGSYYRRYKRPANQIWILYTLESPYHSTFSTFNLPVNWTATHRRDSVLVTPYDKFVHFRNYTSLPNKPLRNYAAGKTKKVAWFVSKCISTNGRQNYARELSKYIDVDIFGRCGTHKCSKMDQQTCFDMLKKKYKFYLSFENSNCKDYITEKFYVNALRNDVIPVVMGAHPDDYAASAPPKSFIHVDFFNSPKQLADYLHKLDKNDDLYNTYFHWKGTGEFINTKFWCRLCNMVHAASNTGYAMSYTDVTQWWNGPGICLKLKNKQSWVSWNFNKKYNNKMLLQSFKLFGRH